MRKERIWGIIYNFPRSSVSRKPVCWFGIRSPRENSKLCFPCRFRYMLSISSWRVNLPQVHSLQERPNMSLMEGRMPAHSEAESQYHKTLILKFLGKKKSLLTPILSPSQDIWWNSELDLRGENIRVHKLYTRTIILGQWGSMTWEHIRTCVLQFIEIVRN